jgi:hypothetical protein
MASGEGLVKTSYSQPLLPEVLRLPFKHFTYTIYLLMIANNSTQSRMALPALTAMLVLGRRKNLGEER